MKKKIIAVIAFVLVVTGVPFVLSREMRRQSEGKRGSRKCQNKEWL